MIKTYTHCRVCNGALQPVLNLGDLHLVGFIPPDAPPTPKYPLHLMACSDCGLVQLEHSVNPDEMYRNYWYKSGTNEQMVAHLKAIPQAAAKYVDLDSGGVVLDIGCNDGTLLSGYTQSVIRVGVDPSNIRPSLDSCDLFVNKYFSADNYHFASRAKVITSIAMFYDLNDPVAFAKDIKQVLHPDGVWILELHYLPDMLNNNGFDAICHEHVTYYNLRSLTGALYRAGLHVIAVELNQVNGGSFRVYVTHEEKPRDYDSASYTSMVDMINNQDVAVPTYADFATRVEKNKRQMVTLLKALKSEGKVVMGYGASTKGATMLQYWGLTPNLLPAIADRNPDKVGLVVAGTGIPIISEDEMRARKPDYLLILPYHFLEGFKKREHEYLASGGAFIIPVPTPKVWRYSADAIEANIQMMQGSFGA